MTDGKFTKEKVESMDLEQAKTCLQGIYKIRRRFLRAIVMNLVTLVIAWELISTFWGEKYSLGLSVGVGLFVWEGYALICNILTRQSYTADSKVVEASLKDRIAMSRLLPRI